MTAPVPLAALLAEGRRLEREATPGPWRYGKAQYLFDDCIESGFNFDEDVIVRDDDPNGDDDPEFVATTGTDVNTEETAEFIAFARTALPRLLDLAEAAVEMRKGVAKSMGRANGRWCEWGERAEMVLAMLEENLAAFDAAASAGEKP